MPEITGLDMSQAFPLPLELLHCICYMQTIL